jgi:hypothetical protein
MERVVFRLLIGKRTNPDAFSGTTKELIEKEATALCERLSGGCGGLVWSGKNKWFLTINFDSDRQPTVENASTALVSRGWRVLGSKNPGREIDCNPPLMRTIQRRAGLVDSIAITSYESTCEIEG